MRVTFALQAPEVRAKLGRGLVSKLAVLLERLVDDVVQLGGHVRVEFAGPWRCLAQNCIEDQSRRPSSERLPTGGHFVEHYAEREQIRTAIDRLAARLFWRHVGR